MANRNRIHGACVFKNEGDGCLSSKYINEDGSPLVETCYLIAESRRPDEPDPFVGSYKSVWLEGVRTDPVSATLTIARADSGRYSLKWQGSKQSYGGVGMLYNGLLICAYWRQ